MRLLLPLALLAGTACGHTVKLASDDAKSTDDAKSAMKSSSKSDKEVEHETAHETASDHETAPALETESDHEHEHSAFRKDSSAEPATSALQKGGNGIMGSIKKALGMGAKEKPKRRKKNTEDPLAKEREEVDVMVAQARKEVHDWHIPSYILVTSKKNGLLEEKTRQMIAALKKYPSQLRTYFSNAFDEPELRYMSKDGLPSVYGIPTITAKAKTVDHDKLFDPAKVDPVDQELYTWIQIQSGEGCNANGITSCLR